MRTVSLVSECQAMFDEWRGGQEEGNVVMLWEQDETYFMVFKLYSTTYFVRMFMIGGSWQLSIDKSLEDYDLEDL